MCIRDSGDDEADASQTEPLPTVEWGDGDTVTVYYNGVMTRSIPCLLYTSRCV